MMFDGSGLGPQPPAGGTHQLLAALLTSLVCPVQGELFVLHFVAGVEGAGETHGCAIQGTDGRLCHDLHAQPTGCWGEDRNETGGRRRKEEVNKH